MGVVNLADLACVLRATTKKVINFFRKKVHPQRKSWLRLCQISHVTEISPVTFNPGTNQLHVMNPSKLNTIHSVQHLQTGIKAVIFYTNDLHASTSDKTHLQQCQQLQTARLTTRLNV